MNAFAKKAGSRSGSVMAVPADTNGAKSKVPLAPSEKRSCRHQALLGSMAVSLITVGTRNAVQGLQRLRAGPIVLQLEPVVEAPCAHDRHDAPR